MPGICIASTEIMVAIAYAGRPVGRGAFWMRLGNSSSTQTFCEQATAMDYMAIAITI